MTISKELQATLELAIAEARRRRHEYLTLEHLLVALCADPVAAKILTACGADFGKLLGDLEDFLAEKAEFPLLCTTEPDEDPDEEDGGAG